MLGKWTVDTQLTLVREIYSEIKKCSVLTGTRAAEISRPVITTAIG